MAEFDELLTEGLREFATEAPTLRPLSYRVRRRVRTGRAGAILASIVVVAGMSAGLFIGAQALNRPPRAHEHHSSYPAQWTATVQARIPIPISQSGQIAVLGSTAWVAESDNGLVVRVDLVTKHVTKILHVGSSLHGGPTGIAEGAGSVWVLDSATGRLLRIAAVTGKVTDQIRIPGGATAVAYGDGSVWVTGPLRGKEGLRLSKIDPARNLVVQSRSILPLSTTAPVCPIFPGPRGLWLACGRPSGITLIDPTSLRPLKALLVNTGGYVPLIAPGQHVVWVLTGTGLVRVDPAAARITATAKINWDTYLLPFQASAFAVDRAGRVWIANSALDVLAPGSLTIHQVANTAGMGIGIINVVVTGSHLWADTGTALVELDVH